MTDNVKIWVAPFLILFFGRLAVDYVYFGFLVPELLTNTVSKISSRGIVKDRLWLGYFSFFILTVGVYFNVMFHYQHYSVLVLTLQGALYSLAVWSTFNFMNFILFDGWEVRMVVTDTLWGTVTNTVLVCITAFVMKM